MEIEGYSVTYFDHIAAFEVPYHWTSVKGGSHMRFVDSLDIHTSMKHVWAPPLTEVQWHSDVIEIRDRITLHRTTWDCHTYIYQATRNLSPIYKIVTKAQGSCEIKHCVTTNRMRHVRHHWGKGENVIQNTWPSLHVSDGLGTRVCTPSFLPGLMFLLTLWTRENQCSLSGFYQSSVQTFWASVVCNNSGWSTWKSWLMLCTC